MVTTDKIAVLCDGTWGGSETKTETNIFLLAEMMGISRELYLSTPSGHPIAHHDTPRGTKACYFSGVGLGGSFLQYLFNGLTASDIDDYCLEVYEYIVQHYSPQSEIWMLGFSRGAYTLRCVAGMINNCGIIKRRRNGRAVLTNDNTELTDEEKALCKQVYSIYRSNDPADHPESPKSATFRERASHDVRTPVKFMGIFDAVGSQGMPYLKPGMGLSFYEFYDTKVSAVVEKVYHAVCIHERMWGFEPCRALPAAHRVGPQFEIHERWFPGCHYDVGRHRFQVFRSGGPEAAVANALNTLAEVVEPNHVFADLALKWMLESIQEHSGDGLISNIDARINNLVANMEGASDAYTGNGDIWSDPLQHLPLGSVWDKLIDTLEQFDGATSTVRNDVIDAVSTLQPIAEPLWKFARLNFHVFDTIVRKAHLNRLPFADSALHVVNDIFSHDPFSNDAQKMLKVLGVMLSSQYLLQELKIILDALFHTRDRRISDVNASVVRYDKEKLGHRTIMEVGRINRPEGVGTYQSQTYENFRLYQKIML
ncbi:hypothetical protein BGZ93_003005 [Podila epicladia]|nr:hypothetical protein BGZ93_003005 [Podila epicladia]